MSTIVHFIAVGQGNMVLIEAHDGKKFVFDCNVTDDNEDQVLDYVADQIGEGTQLHAFICSHREADHIRGVERLHDRFPIGSIWDSNYPGTTTDCAEYLEYMNLRRRLGSETKKKGTRQDFGRTRFRYLSAQDARVEENANAQGIVIKVEHRSANSDRVLSSAMLPGDSDAQTWRHGIMVDYAASQVSSSILMAAHHGSITFFDDPDDEKYYYVDHMKAIKPKMTLISVGKNNYGHPAPAATKLYMEYSSGSDKRNKVYRTDKEGTMRLTLKDEGGWNLKINQ